jgi:hypothetical protein
MRAAAIAVGLITESYPEACVSERERERESRSMFGTLVVAYRDKNKEDDSKLGFVSVQVCHCLDCDSLEDLLC